MSASMAEVIRKAMRDHRVVWVLVGKPGDAVAKCRSCGYLGSELEAYEHQSNIASEQLAANGYGKLEEAKAAALREAALELMNVNEHESRMPGIRFAVGFLGGKLREK